MESLIDRFGEAQLLFVAGLALGLLFGAAAGHSKFCLRAATVELAEGRLGPRIVIWLVAFLTAMGAVQAAIAWGGMDVSGARQLAATGSLSGAILGGLMFGAGMVLARGCASRLLVLSASGNLRAIITGLLLTLTAQASLNGALAPARESLAQLWTVPGGEMRALSSYLDVGPPSLIALAVVGLLAAIALGRHHKLPAGEIAAGAAVGLAVFGGWALTAWIAATSFEVVAVQSITFTGPSTDTLMALVNTREIVPTFGLGLVPGVFLGALAVAVLKREAGIQRFGSDTPMERYLIGALLMGFGSMLAGGCAVGAGMAGGSILALTAWIALLFMWIGAMATHWALKLREAPAPA